MTVQTVLGPVPAGTLGPTLVHEHVFSDLTCLFQAPEGATSRARAEEPITLANLGWVRHNYFSHRPNLLLDDLDTAAAELRLFREWGGGTIVDVTPPGIGRDPVGLARVSRATGVNVVMCTGFYVEATHPPRVAAMDEGELATHMVTELRDGIVEVAPGADDLMERRIPTGVRPGIIKVGCTWPVTPTERRVLLGAVAAQRETGTAITIHTGRDERSPLEILEIVRDAGADLSRVVLGHLDLRVQSVSILYELAAAGVYLEWDLFGTESSFYPFTPFDMPSDAQRLDVVAELLAAGHAERALISHDICHRYRLTRYGGHGYKHILENVVPFMRKKGFAEGDIDTILVANPARVLSRV